MTDLHNYREVGKFYLLSPILTPIGAVDAQKLTEQIDYMIDEKKYILGIDLSEIDFLYSDCLNVLAKKSEDILSKGGKLILLTAEVNIQQAIQNAGLIELLPYYQKETDLLLASMESAGVASENKITAEISALTSKESLVSPEEVSEEFPKYYGAKHSSSRLFLLVIVLILTSAYGVWYSFG